MDPIGWAVIAAVAAITVAEAQARMPAPAPAPGDKDLIEDGRLVIRVDESD